MVRRRRRPGLFFEQHIHQENHVGAGTDLSNNGYFGAIAAYSDIVLTDSLSTANTESGVWLYDSTATVTDNLFQSNTAYGMMCSSSTLESCSGNDLSDNASGEHYSCSDSCGQPAETVP